MRIPRSKTSKLPDALVADANVLISAALGGKAADALVLALARGIRVHGAREVAEEVTEWLPVLARKRDLNVGLLLGVFALMPIEWAEPSLTVLYKDKAEQLIGGRDPDDWPTIAVAINLSGRLRPLKQPTHPLVVRLSRTTMEARHRLNRLSLEWQTPMRSLGEPIKRNPKALAGALLFRALFRPRQGDHQKVAIWTGDQDYEGVGIPTIRTGELLRLLGN